MKKTKLPVKLYGYTDSVGGMFIWDTATNAAKGKSDENYDTGLLFTSENCEDSFKLPQDVILELTIKASDKKFKPCGCGNGFVAK